MPIILRVWCFLDRACTQMRTPDKKPDCTFVQSGIRQEWRGKTGHVPASKRTVRALQKFQSNQKIKWKNQQDIAAMQNAALHNCHD
jgi:hypothetical protein